MRSLTASVPLAGNSENEALHDGRPQRARLHVRRRPDCRPHAKQQMPYFLSKLTPPRKTFLRDMSPEELDVMRAHQDYWRAHVDAGMVIVLGSVDDPEGAWGVAISDAPSRERLSLISARHSKHV